MYKYSKIVKERLLKDNYMAFLWMFYRLTSKSHIHFSEELAMEHSIKDVIMKDFDSLAMTTLRKGHFALCCYILQLNL